MKRLATIVVVIIAAAAGAREARADHAITVRATPVASGADPSSLFDTQLAAEIAPYKAPCVTGGGCGSTVVRQQAVGGEMLVQIRRADISGGSDLGDRGPDDQLLLRRDDRWYALGTLPLSEEECGAGHCTTQSITSIHARRAGDILWVTLRERTTRAATDPTSCLQGCPPDIADADVVYAVFLNATPACARVFPRVVFPDGGGYDSYRAEIVRRDVVMRWRPDSGAPATRVVVHVRAWRAPDLDAR